MDLNREVAEKVMGWGTSGWAEKSGGGLWCSGTDTGGYYVWNPLKDLNQCFEVVEVLQKDLGWSLYRYVRKYRMVFTTISKPIKDYWGEGETPNEAILKAALEVVKQ